MLNLCFVMKGGGVKLLSLPGLALTLDGAALPCCRERVQEGREERKKERKKRTIVQTAKKKVLFPFIIFLKHLTAFKSAGSVSAAMNANSFTE